MSQKVQAINQTKFGQSIKYSMRNTFLEKIFIKSVGETSPRPFSKKSKLSIFLDQQSEVLQSLSLLFIQVEDYQNVLN